MRIALLTLEALANAHAVRRFVARRASEIVLVGLSDPFRPEAGGAIGQMRTRLRRSGPRILPYLALNFSVPRLVGHLPMPRSGRDPAFRPLASLCRDLAIPAVTLRDVNGSAFRDTLLAARPDVIVTFHFDQILSADTIAAAPQGGLNVHPGLLPLHRGPVPTIHALLDTPVRLGVSIHRLVPQIDAGALLAQVAMPDRAGLTALEAASLLHEAALPLLETVLGDLAAGRLIETALPTLPYRPFPTPAEMTALARQGRAAAGWRDLGHALRTPIVDRIHRPAGKR